MAFATLFLGVEGIICSRDKIEGVCTYNHSLLTETKVVEHYEAGIPCLANARACYATETRTAI